MTDPPPSYTDIGYEVTHAVATVTLNRPHRRNAFTVRMANELADALGRADEDDAVRAVILTGAGADFCVGADLSDGDLTAPNATKTTRSSDEPPAATTPSEHHAREATTVDETAARTRPHNPTDSLEQAGDHEHPGATQQTSDHNPTRDQRHNEDHDHTADQQHKRNQGLARDQARTDVRDHTTDRDHPRNRDNTEDRDQSDVRDHPGNGDHTGNRDHPRNRNQTGDRDHPGNRNHNENRDPTEGGNPAGRPDSIGYREPAGRVSLRIFAMRKPVIAALRGAAVGAGSTIILPVDFRLAAANTRFGFVFTRRGLVPEGASTWFLPRLVGLGRALDWMVSGRVFGADEAHAAGLVTSLHEPDEVLEAARALAADLVATTSPVAVAITRQMLFRMAPLDSPFPARDLDSRLIADAAGSPDVVEGVRSFLEKRQPSFPGRVSADLPDYLPWSARIGRMGRT